MKFLSYLNAAVLLFLASCQSPQASKADVKSESVKEVSILPKKGDLQTEAISDHTVPKTTADNWKDGWTVYCAQTQGSTSVNIGPGNLTSHSYSSENILALKVNENVNALRVYFALSTPLQPTDPLTGGFSTFLVGVDTLDSNDVYRDTSHAILKNGGDGNGVWKEKSDAEAKIANWVNYVDNLNETYLRAYAYTFSWSYVEQELNKGGNQKLYFAPALRTVYMPDLAGFSVDVSDPNNCFSNSLGFQVFDMVMEGTNNAATGSCGEVVNFANPCPVYCGQQNLLGGL